MFRGRERPRCALIKSPSIRNLFVWFTKSELAPLRIRKIRTKANKEGGPANRQDLFCSDICQSALIEFEQACAN
jgi:hypothetical protein